MCDFFGRIIKSIYKISKSILLNQLESDILTLSIFLKLYPISGSEHNWQLNQLARSIRTCGLGYATRILSKHWQNRITMRARMGTLLNFVFVRSAVRLNLALLCIFCCVLYFRNVNLNTIKATHTSIFFKRSRANPLLYRV